MNVSDDVLIKTSHVENILQNEVSSHRLANLNFKFMWTRIIAFSIPKMLSFISQHTPDAKEKQTKQNQEIVKHARLRPCLQKRRINRLVDAYQMSDSTVLIPERTYFSRDAAKPAQQWWLRSGGASSHSDQSRCPLNLLVLVYPQCTQQRLVNRLTRLCEYPVWSESFLVGVHVIFLNFKNCINLSQAVVELWPFIHKLTTEEWTERQMNKHDVYRTITFNRSCNVLNVNPSGKKQHTVPNVCQNRRPYRTQTLFQFSASPSPILCTTENATFAHFVKKSMHLKTGFFVRLSSPVLVSEWTTISKQVCSLIDRFRSIYDVRR